MTQIMHHIYIFENTLSSG